MENHIEIWLIWELISGFEGFGFGAAPTLTGVDGV